MKINEAYSMAKNNIKGRKKIGSTLFTILFFTMFIYILLNSMVHSINNLVDFTKEIPLARQLVYQAESKDDSLYQNLKNVCKDLEHVIGVNKYTLQNIVDVEGIIDDVNLEMVVFSYSDNYEDYLIEGELPKENEVLLPHYLYGNSSDSYRDLSVYIGETLTLYIDDYNDEIHTYKCTVSGTYDNIFTLTGSDTMIANTTDAINIYELSNTGIEDELQRQMEESGNYNKDTYIGFENEYYFTVCLDKYENLESVKEFIKDELGVSGSVKVKFSNNELNNVFAYVQFIGMFIIIILLAAVTIMMVILIGNDINGRKKEMAIYLVQGYTEKNLIQILSFEYIARLIPVYIFSIIAAQIMLSLENVAIRKWFSLEYRPLHMELSLLTLVIGVVIMIIIAGVAIYQIKRQLNRINILKELKVEG